MAYQWQRAKELFGAALNLDAEKRAAFLRDACGMDKTLIAEVESLLAAHDHADNLSANPWRD
jgi:hypothetical protein